MGLDLLHTSASVVQAIPTLALSNLARSALRAWAKTAAADLAGSGVTVNLACPGTHATDRTLDIGPRTAPIGVPSDFGSIVTFLCSEQAGYLNGATVVVDGGASLGL